MIEIVFKLDENKAIAYDSENKVGECDFEKIDDIWNITHTEVDSDYQGQGIARKLVENVIENSQKYNKKIKAQYPLIKDIVLLTKSVVDLFCFNGSLFTKVCNSVRD